MKIGRSWVPGGLPNLYYYVNQTGRIIGETTITGTGNSSKYSCIVYPNPRDSETLGMYISSEKAKEAIEYYWYESDSVYDTSNNILK
jgi:hypothetical protein